MSATPTTLTSNTNRTEMYDELDNYDIDDFSDNPFGPPSPEPATKKRKEPESGLGIDEEVSVQKRARVPNVKLDEERLLGPKGIPKLRSRAGNLKIKGKGHEFSDAARLLSFYQLWLDDLFPKAKFLDALVMVEKAGHKKQVMAARNDFIQERKPKDRVDDELDNGEGSVEIEALTRDSSTNAVKLSAVSRPRTPPQDLDVPNDDDLYGATPRTSRPIVPIRNDMPDDDDLEALIAEAEGRDHPSVSKPADTELDADDLDALIAEAENQDKGNHSTLEKSSGNENVLGDFDDDEAAMQEMEGLW